MLGCPAAAGGDRAVLLRGPSRSAGGRPAGHLIRHGQVNSGRRATKYSVPPGRRGDKLMDIDRRLHEAGWAALAREPRTRAATAERGQFGRSRTATAVEEGTRPDGGCGGRRSNHLWLRERAWVNDRRPVIACGVGDHALSFGELPVAEAIDLDRCTALEHCHRAACRRLCCFSAASLHRDVRSGSRDRHRSSPSAKRQWRALLSRRCLSASGRQRLWNSHTFGLSGRFGHLLSEPGRARKCGTR